ncbi:hypothetical protein E2C01_089646 [Portunus trituberculatus]|uniref:Uncharacterized protein n=1 Tax=Portunus trituberculatus TaxID=210409 RepID=A0A5B7JIT5_PORTR|nr:hypothetical protein [Portunus trituberculatus]
MTVGGWVEEGWVSSGVGSEEEDKQGGRASRILGAPQAHPRVEGAQRRTKEEQTAAYVLALRTLFKRQGGKKRREEESIEQERNVLGVLKEIARSKTRGEDEEGKYEEGKRIKCFEKDYRRW